MFSYLKRYALLGLAITTMFWVGCSKSSSNDNTPATTQLYQAYKSCKSRTGGGSVYYSACYSAQDQYTNCDCVSDMQAQSIYTFKGQSTTGYNYYNQYGGDETIINSYISYLNQVPADAKRRMIEAWNKIGTNTGYSNGYNNSGYNSGYSNGGGNYAQYCQSIGGYYDSQTGVCWY